MARRFGDWASCWSAWGASERGRGGSSAPTDEPSRRCAAPPLRARRIPATVILASNRTAHAGEARHQAGDLALMILRTLDVPGPLHGYGIARRIEETSRNRLALNYGTLYPALLKMEQEGAIAAEWRPSENNRRAKYYTLTPVGRKLLARETREWIETADLIAAFLNLRPES
ncbi:MAG: PadR family transcriptional regulator [Gemmatimonadetes bacterium]|nr:PadR family transcriptional regulator [Gemmatimonadota bacterium]